MKEPLLAVLPSFFLTGPLALLALLFPAAFAGLSLWLKRYKFFLTVLSITSLFYLVHTWWLRAWWKDSFLGDTRLPWLMLALFSLLALPWAWRRRPNQARFWPPSGESIALTLTMLIALGYTIVPRATTQSGVLWIFEMPEPGTIVSSPCLHKNRLYVAAAIATPTRQAGRLYCLDALSGKQLWAYDDVGTMKPVFSSPVCVDNRLYVGEGFHRDADCKLHCVDLANGTKLWTFPTSSHVESSPLVHDGRVYFGAGDDGLYCVDAGTGKDLWHFTGGHVDASPVLSRECVVFGSTKGERYALHALDRTSGLERWQAASDMPVVGSPHDLGASIAVGIGRGNYAQPGVPPGGGLWVVDSRSGKEQWRLPLPDVVLARPRGNGDAIVFGCRDGGLRMADCTSRRLIWQQDLKDPLFAAPLLDDCIMQISESGRLAALDHATGKVLWEFDSAAKVQSRIEALATPALMQVTDDHHLIFIACGAKGVVRDSALVICLTRKTLR